MAPELRIRDCPIVYISGAKLYYKQQIRSDASQAVQKLRYEAHCFYKRTTNVKSVANMSRVTIAKTNSEELCDVADGNSNLRVRQSVLGLFGSEMEVNIRQYESCTSQRCFIRNGR